MADHIAIRTDLLQTAELPVWGIYVLWSAVHETTSTYVKESKRVCPSCKPVIVGHFPGGDTDGQRTDCIAWYANICNLYGYYINH
jgi:hypothetical protein